MLSCTVFARLDVRTRWHLPYRPSPAPKVPHDAQVLGTGDVPPAHPTHVPSKPLYQRCARRRAVRYSSATPKLVIVAAERRASLFAQMNDHRRVHDAHTQGSGAPMPVFGSKFRSRSRRLVAGVAVAASAALGIGVRGGVAEAAPKAQPLPHFTGTGDQFGLVGDHDFCRGAVHVTLTSPRRGVVKVTLTSRGFSGQGAGWSRNPHCSTLFIFTNGASLVPQEKFIPATFGREPGQSVSGELRTGSGLAQPVVRAYARNTPVRLPQSSGFVGWVVVP